PYCSGLQILSASSGTFADHRNSGDSINNSNCSWIISPEESEIDGASITLSFSHFDLEPGFDFVQIWDGDDPATAPQIAKYTGTDIPPPVIATSGKMFIQFTTDLGITRTGFVASYTIESCPGQCSNRGWCNSGTCV